MAKNARNYHKEGLKETLTEAALAEIEEKGIAEASLRGIAARAGVSRAAPYRHFRDKEELLGMTALECARRFALALARARDSAPPGDPLEPLSALGDAYLRFSREEKRAAKVFFSARGQTALQATITRLGGFPDDMEDPFDILLSTVARYFEGSGILKRVSPPVLSLLIWAMVQGISFLEGEGFIRRGSSNFGYGENDTVSALYQAMNLALKALKDYEAP